jgi:hypothetical protein
MTAEKKKPSKRGKSRDKSQSYLEKMVSKTAKFKVEDLLDLYRIYDSLVTDVAFRLLLFPYTRFARVWLRDQVRDLLAGTDRNRLILTSRARKTTEADFANLPTDTKNRWSEHLKQKHTFFVRNVTRLLHTFDTTGSVPSEAEVQSLGLSRLVYDDMGTYYVAVMNNYPSLVAEWITAKAEGDDEECTRIDVELRLLEAETGVLRDDAWYVTVNLRAIYDQIDTMVNRVTMAYARLLFRFAHQLRGVTSTEENFSAGYEGMIRAARNYDPIDGASFTAHCQWWVRSAVLQRQRQSSIILLPTTTWYQLSLLQKGQGDLSDGRVSDLKERAEMFYASSTNANRTNADEDTSPEEMSAFEGVRVTSPDAYAVLGDSLNAAQAVELGYESTNTNNVGRDRIEAAFELLDQEDLTLIFPVLLWALNSGIDGTMLAEVTSPTYLSEHERKNEYNRHQTVKSRIHRLVPSNQSSPEKSTNGKLPQARSTKSKKASLG